MDPIGMAFLGAGIGVAGVTIGAGIGIGKIGSGACIGIARQPEAAGEIRGAMIITAAMIEGVALLSAAICFLLYIK